MKPVFLRERDITRQPIFRRKREAVKNKNKNGKMEKGKGCERKKNAPARDAYVCKVGFARFAL